MYLKHAGNLCRGVGLRNVIACRQQDYQFTCLYLHMPAPGPILYKVHNYEQCSKAPATTDLIFRGGLCTQEWVRGGLILKSGSGVGSYSKVGQGWA